MRRDPLSGRLVVVAPDRARRPGAFPQLEPPPDPGELDECPFCAGREDRTPPETLRLPAEGGWQVRVVPNLYPAFERQEVVVHTPEHVRSIAELSGEALSLVAEAWRSRAAAARAEGFAYVHAIVNEGKAAGASLPHTHSQLIWLREPPPAVSLEGTMDAVTDGELVLEQAGLVALCPAVSADPYEVRVAPASREPDAFASPLLAVALDMAAEVVRRLRARRAGRAGEPLASRRALVAHRHRAAAASPCRHRARRRHPREPAAARRSGGETARLALLLGLDLRLGLGDDRLRRRLCLRIRLLRRCRSLLSTTGARLDTRSPFSRSRMTITPCVARPARRMPSVGMRITWPLVEISIT